jgi:lysophospholipase L1-like esterase
MTLNYLALGDSYTIGELVPLFENFPYRLVQILRSNQIDMQAPEILAKTGWTTDELLSAMEEYRFQKKYELVTLLIGVNNQYRGRSAEEFREQFSILFHRALDYAGGRKERVVVLSIPDWGLTPFAAERDRAAIAHEIDMFNEICKQEAEENGVSFADITFGQRQRSSDLSYLVTDQLHPSGKEYAEWAKLISEKLIPVFHA